jgi:hypothetical protein
VHRRKLKKFEVVNFFSVRRSKNTVDSDRMNSRVEIGYVGLGFKCGCIETGSGIDALAFHFSSD